MAQRRIFAVGYDFPGGTVEQIRFESDRTLLDADIVIYEPTLGDYSVEEWIRGRPELTEYSSFAVPQYVSHWRSELTDFLAAGKTVVLFLSKPIRVAVDTGERKYSGSGRNQTTTRMLGELSSYEAVPLTLTLRTRSGEGVVPAGDLGNLAPFWKEFGDSFEYETTVTGDNISPKLITRNGNHVVAAILPVSPGNVIMMPPVRFDYEEFADFGKDDEPDTWNAESQRFGKKLAKAFAALDREIRRDSDKTPIPIWAQDDSYRFPVEVSIERKIEKVSKKIAAARETKRLLEQRLEDVGRLRALLYETGKALEDAVRQSLTIMGFHAEAVVENDSEFDAIFVSDEGRFLGEIEGKDRKAINVEKLSQLERNLQEDFARDEVESFANGVLFGNAFRLQPIDERPEFFTDKCHSGALRGEVALVRTPDMFEPTRYLQSCSDPDFAAECRRAILAAKGEIVVFPRVPNKSAGEEN